MILACSLLLVCLRFAPLCRKQVVPYPTAIKLEPCGGQFAAVLPGQFGLVYPGQFYWSIQGG